jgi:uncharacterized protein (DUF2147 family)
MINLLKGGLLAAFMLLAFSATAEAQDSPVGRWRTIDDATGEAKAIVRIEERNGRLVGTIEQLFRAPDEDQDPVCTECSGENRGQRIRGMQILWGLERSGAEWSGGQILDPKNGKVYSARARLNDRGELEVRGFLRVPLMGSTLGRTQIWQPVRS